eukprot:3951707-Prymnesium_polylepis.1
MHWRIEYDGGTVKPVRVSRSRLPTHEKSAVSARPVKPQALARSSTSLSSTRSRHTYSCSVFAPSGCAARTSSNVDVVSCESAMWSPCFFAAFAVAISPSAWNMRWPAHEVMK